MSTFYDETKPLENMSEDELREELRKIRQSRVTAAVAPKKKSAPKKKTPKKTPALDGDMSPTMAKLLLEKLEARDEGK